MPLAKETTGGVYVSVLGGFSVTIDGKKLPEGLFERRRARDLVTLLALVPGHKMRRYQAIEVLWPGEDYFRGPRKLYESTGEARKRLSSGGTGANAIISDRVQGAIGFDSAVVRCDIDEFESEARKVLMEDSDDFEVLDHARRMQRIYSTGPDEHLEALGELVGDRVADLRTMFVDAAVAAGEAALRLGKARLAIQYGTDAHRLDSLREDAIILLVRALRVVGRGYEIPDLYRRYSRHLLEVQGVPPSLTLRRVVECELGMGSGPDLDAGPAPLPS